MLPGRQSLAGRGPDAGIGVRPHFQARACPPAPTALVTTGVCSVAPRGSHAMGEGPLCVSQGLGCCTRVLPVPPNTPLLCCRVCSGEDQTWQSQLPWLRLGGREPPRGKRMAHQCWWLWERRERRSLADEKAELWAESSIQDQEGQKHKQSRQDPRETGGA